MRIDLDGLGPDGREGSRWQYLGGTLSERCVLRHSCTSEEAAPGFLVLSFSDEPRSELHLRCPANSLLVEEFSFTGSPLSWSQRAPVWSQVSRMGVIGGLDRGGIGSGFPMSTSGHGTRHVPYKMRASVGRRRASVHRRSDPHRDLRGSRGLGYQWDGQRIPKRHQDGPALRFSVP